jgi:hypothetical protein
MGSQHERPFRAAAGCRRIRVDRGRAAADGWAGRRALRADAAARSRSRRTGGDGEAVAMPITLDGVDLTDISLLASSGWSAVGTIVTESGAAPDVSPLRFRMTARLVDGDTNPGPPPYLEDGNWNDPEYLESIRPYGRKVTLSGGGSASPALTMVTP